MVEIQRIYVFLALFTFVYFLESIGGTYMLTAVVNIERQFRIPSKLSGFLVSAHDISYVLSVIFVSYYGSRGNRAKWIGFGTILISVAHILTSAPNFLFRAPQPQLNLRQVEDRLNPSARLASQNATIADFLHYAPIRDWVPARLREQILSALEHPDWVPPASRQRGLNRTRTYGRSFYVIDEPLLGEILERADEFLATTRAQNATTVDALQNSLRRFVHNREEFPEADLKIMRRSAVAPFSFCNRLVNDLRVILQNAKCQRNSSNFAPLFIIFGAMLILGLGRTMPWALGIPLIDDNVKRHKMPLYFAMINFFKILGPICGFLIGAAVNKLYFTFPVPAPKGLSPQDPTWIGAWWLGFLVIGIVKIGPSVVLFFFPESSSKKSSKKSHLPTPSTNGGFPLTNGSANGHLKSLNGNGIAPVVKEKKKLTLYDRHVKAEGEAPGLLAFIRSYGVVLRSKVYVSAVVARVLDVFAFKGYMVFLPKFLENHYGIPQYRVHIYMALFGVLGFACGVASGGVIMRKLHLNGRRAAYYVLIASVLNTGLFMVKAFMGCHSVVNNVGREGASSGFNYTQECNAQCGCESAKLYPVCDAQGHIFYSPCHAGCRHVGINDLNDQLEFSECDCVPGDGMVSRSLCRDDCDVPKYAFFALIVVGAFIAGTAVVPGMLLLLRSVPPHARSPALGLQGMLVSGIGTLPSPILWGWLIDSTCLVWDNDCEKGSCQIYDPWQLRMRMHWLYVIIRCGSLVADIYMAYHAKGLNLQEDEPSASTSSSSNSCPSTDQTKNAEISLDAIRPTTGAYEK